MILYFWVDKVICFCVFKILRWFVFVPLKYIGDLFLCASNTEKLKVQVLYFVLHFCPCSLNIYTTDEWSVVPTIEFSKNLCNEIFDQSYLKSSPCLSLDIDFKSLIVSLVEDKVHFSVELHVLLFQSNSSARHSL